MGERRATGKRNVAATIPLPERRVYRKIAVRRTPQPEPILPKRVEPKPKAQRSSRAGRTQSLLASPSSSATSPSASSSPTVPLFKSPPLGPPYVSHFAIPFHTSYVAASIQEQQYPRIVPHSIARSDTSLRIQSRPSSPPTLPQQAIAMIIDHVAYTDDFDEFPTIPLTDLASCSLTCRGWLDRSSHHLFRRLRFQASSTEPSMEEGEKAYERLETLMLAATQSRRLTTYITGASIWWSVGMPPTVIMVDTIVLAFPNLAYLRFQNSPSPDLSISELRTRKHYSVKCFDLWMRRGQYTSQNWIFEYLRLFQRVDHLRIVAASRLDETEYLPRSSHLHVKHLELCESAFDILRALKRTLALSSLTSLTIDWPSSWDPEIVSIYTLDQFLETCSATLTHFSLSCETQRRPHWKSPKPTRLENLSKCNKLVSVKLNIIEAWEFEEIYDDLLRWMPTSIRRICFTADSPIPPSERRRGPDLIYWPALAEWVASRPALERVDVLVDVISQHFADDDPTTEALRADPPRCAAMERRMIERDFGWVEAQYKSMRNYMSRNDRRKVNVLLNLMLRRKLCRDEGRRVVTLQLDTRQGKVLRFGP